MGLRSIHKENEEESYSELEFTGRNNQTHNSVSTERAREECEHNEQEKLTSGLGTLRDTNTATANNDSHGEKNESSKEKVETNSDDMIIELEQNPAYTTSVHYVNSKEK